MAAIDFPSNPQNGDTFSPEGLDTQYTYQNGVWTGVVTVADIYLPLTGGNLTGDVYFKDGTAENIFLSTTGNANFKGDVDIDGNLALGNIADVEAAIANAGGGGTGDSIANGTSKLDFTATDGDLESNVTFLPTVTNSIDLGSTTLGWQNVYVNKTLTMGSDLNTPYIVVDGQTGKFKGVGDLEIGPIGNPSVVVDASGTVTANGTLSIGPVGGAASVTLTTTGEITGTSLAGTGTVNLVVDNTGKLVRGSAVPSPVWTQNDTNLYPANAASNLLIGGTLPASPNASISSAGAGVFTSGVINDGSLIINTGSTPSITLQNDGDIVMSGEITGCTGVSGAGIFTLAGAGVVIDNTSAGSYVFTNAGSTTNKGTLDFSGTSDSRTYTFPDKDGTVAMTSDFTGTGVTFKGTTNVTDAAPTPVAPGDIYVNTVAGDAVASWTGIDGDAVAQNQLVFYVADTGAGAAGWQLGGITDESDFVTVNTDQDVGGVKTFTSNVQVGTSASPTITLNTTGAASFTGRLDVQRDDNTSAGLVVENAAGADVHLFYGSGAATLASNKIQFTTTGGGSFDDSITAASVTSTGNVTVGGDITTDNLTIYETGGVQPTQGTITSSEFDLRKGIAWTAGAIDIPNPSNAVAGMTGQILMTAAPNSWGSAFKFPGGVGNVQPTTQSYPALVPYFVQNSGVILLGNVISY